ncbi:hypothetical protein LTR78_000055 [Recurvomyces mirabilis]|uniref:Fungal N-terminal domain-containing protein n=1 Tax=Recurvomyces mirabilis TaxID=574656 RepID=A0AAE0WX75_9PEZI|nr:hypothetical protein LTR78_000055 [Recurvomyces mirabilis]KAK5161711.1 hypothetical protein LTS14_000056 [Recurvomyces mirabilis]
MAEILALVVSGVGVAGLALQLAESAKKLNDLVERIDDEPLHLKRLVDDIDVTSKLISALHAEVTRQIVVDTEVLKQCEGLCQSSIGSVRTTLEDLDQQMQYKRFRTSIKLVWKDGKLARILEQLKSCKTDLGIAHSLYSAACQRHALRNSFSLVMMQQQTINDLQQTSILFQTMQLQMKEQIQHGRAEILQQVQTVESRMLRRTHQCDLLVIQQLQHSSPVLTNMDELIPLSGAASYTSAHVAYASRQRTLAKLARWLRRYEIHCVRLEFQALRLVMKIKSEALPRQLPPLPYFTASNAELSTLRSNCMILVAAAFHCLRKGRFDLLSTEVTHLQAEMRQAAAQDTAKPLWHAMDEARDRVRLDAGPGKDKRDYDLIEIVHVARSPASASVAASNAISGECYEIVELLRRLFETLSVLSIDSCQIKDPQGNLFKTLDWLRELPR